MKNLIGLALILLHVICLTACSRNRKISGECESPAAIYANQNEGTGEFIEPFTLSPEERRKLRAEGSIRLQKGIDRMHAYGHLKIADGEPDTLADGLLTGTWNEIGSYNTAGRVWASEIDFSSGAVYVFSQGGNLWKGDLNGDNWEIINDNFNIQSVIFLRKIGDRLIAGIDAYLYLFGVQGFYYTEDEGETWQQATGLENVDSTGNVFDITMLNNPEHTIYLLAFEVDQVTSENVISIYRSHDLGTSFERTATFDMDLYGDPNLFAIWAPRYGEAKCYFLENSNLYYLDEEGVPQYLSTAPAISSSLHLLNGYGDADTTIIYLGINDPALFIVHFYSSPDGNSWNSLTDLSTQYVLRKSFDVSSVSMEALFAGSVDCYRSHDGAESWNAINSWLDYYDDITTKLHGDILFMKSFKDTITGEHVNLISTDGGLYKSYDDGLTVENLSIDGMRNAQYYDVFTYRDSTDIIFGGAQDQGMQRTESVSDGQYRFEQIVHGDYGIFASTDGGNNLWYQYPGFVSHLKNASTNNLSVTYFYSVSKLWMCPLVADPFDPNTSWFGYKSYIYKLQRSGFSIIPTEQDFDFSSGSGQLSGLEISPLNSAYRYALNSDGKFFYSINDGVDWNETESFIGPKILMTNPWYKRIALPVVGSKSNPEIVYVAGGNIVPQVYVSIDHGMTFIPMSEGLPATYVYDIDVVTGDSILFAATDAGPYVYLKSQGKWFDMLGSHAPVQVYRSVEYIDEIKTARFGTYGRGIWDFKSEQLPDYVSIQNPNSVSLDIFPNPARQFINLISNFDLKNAVISIVDMNGKMQWNSNGINLISGIPFHLTLPNLAGGTYFITVQSEQNRIVSKLILL